MIIQVNNEKGNNKSVIRKRRFLLELVDLSMDINSISMVLFAAICKKTIMSSDIIVM